MGEIVAMAASICKSNGCTPRDVYKHHLSELKALMNEGVGMIIKPTSIQVAE